MRAGGYGRIPAKVQHFSYFSFLLGDQGRNSCILAGLTFNKKRLRRNTVDLQYFRLLIIRRRAEQCALCRGGSEPSQDMEQARAGGRRKPAAMLRRQRNINGPRAPQGQKLRSTESSARPRAPQYRKLRSTKSSAVKSSAVPKAPQGQKLRSTKSSAGSKAPFCETTRQKQYQSVQGTLNAGRKRGWFAHFDDIPVIEDP